jgi:hypothetical protein
MFISKREQGEREREIICLKTFKGIQRKVGLHATIPPKYGGNFSILQNSYEAIVQSKDPLQEINKSSLARNQQTYTTTKWHNTHTTPFHSSNGPKLACRYSDHVVIVEMGDLDVSGL